MSEHVYRTNIVAKIQILAHTVENTVENTDRCENTDAKNRTNIIAKIQFFEKNSFSGTNTLTHVW